MSIVKTLSFTLFIAGVLSSSILRGDDWPTYRHDARRSGVSAATLKFPLSELWQVKGGHPRQAWSGPAKWDAYSGNSGLQSMRNFDPCFYVTSAEGLVYFGSSHDNAVHALDAETGEERWVFFTEAPVRLPPTIYNGVAYAGSDDGHLYALDARSGNLLWKDRGSPVDRRIPSNASMISLWPVRTAPLVVNDTLFFTASLTPWESSWLIAANPKTGSRQFSREISNVTLQGALLATANTLIAPQGRSAPLLYDLKTGEPSGAIGHAGGVFCLVTEDNQLISGPKSQKAKDNQLFLTDAKGARVATFNDTSCAVVANGVAYLHTRGSLKAVTLEKTKDELSGWSVDTPAPSELIVCSESVILGHDGGIKAYSRENGSLLWEVMIPEGGAVHGLAISGKMLYASDSHGTIRAFAP